MAQYFKYEGKGHAVEHLLFEVKEGMVEKFIKIDHEIWTKKLAQYPGFISKEVWVSEKNPNQVHTIIYWETMEQWKAIPHEELEEQDRIFTEKMGAENFKFAAALHEEDQLYRVTEYKL